MTTGRINQVTIVRRPARPPGGGGRARVQVVEGVTSTRPGPRRANSIAPVGPRGHPFAPTGFSKAESAEEPGHPWAPALWHVRFRWRLPVAGHAPRGGCRYTRVPPIPFPISMANGQQPTDSFGRDTVREPSRLRTSPMTAPGRLRDSRRPWVDDRRRRRLTSGPVVTARWQYQSARSHRSVRRTWFNGGRMGLAYSEGNRGED